MVIRDDRLIRRKDPPHGVKLDDVQGSFLETFYTKWDRVLISCPTCFRSHFVTVDGCPGEEEAATATAMVDGRKVA